MVSSVPDPAYVERTLDLGGLLAKKSHFLFGPRQTGKSALMWRHFLQALWSGEFV